MKNFSELAQTKAMRNVVNGQELVDWLAKASDEKLGHGARDEKARAWVAGVGRRHMHRQAPAIELSQEEVRLLAESHSWVALAAREGRPLHRLDLSAGEGEELASILDWMRSERGPGLASDWSRVSWPQGVKAHQAWIDEMNRAAQKLLSAQQAFDGCEVAASVTDVEGLEGWSWVKVVSKEALEREGALMRHCVGSYAERVERGACAVWSLRDVEGKPLVTVETSHVPRGVSMRQVKGFANSTPASSHAQALGALFGHFAAQQTPVVSAGPDLAKAGLGVTPKGFGEQKLWRKGSALDQQEAVVRMRSVIQQDQELTPEWAHWAADLGFKDALKAARLQHFQPDVHENLWLKTAVEKSGLMWASGFSSPLLVDPESSSDLQACLDFARESRFDLSSAEAVQAALFFSKAGAREAVRELAPNLEQAFKNKEPGIENLNAALLTQGSAMALVGGRLWDGSDAGLPAWAQACDQLASDPKAAISEGLAALEFCVAHERFELAKPLARFLGDADERWPAPALSMAERLQKKGCVIERACQARGSQAMFWRQNEHCQEMALLRATEDPTPSNIVFPVAAHFQWAEPLAQILSALELQEAFALAKELMEAGVDSSWLSQVRPVNRLVLLETRDASARSGMIAGVQEAISQLQSLKENAQQAPLEMLDEWKAVFDDFHVFAQFAAPHLKDPESFNEILWSSAPMISARHKLAQLDDHAVDNVMEGFIRLLNKAVQGQPLLQAPHERVKLEAHDDPGSFIVMGIKKSIVQFFVVEFNEEQRSAMIKAITGASHAERFKIKDKIHSRRHLQDQRSHWKKSISRLDSMG
jgi:hypothetical protein